GVLRRRAAGVHGPALRRVPCVAAADGHRARAQVRAARRGPARRRPRPRDGAGVTAAILGVGEVVKPPKGTSSLDLHAQAARAAMADAGLGPGDIDGLVVGYSLTE